MLAFQESQRKCTESVSCYLFLVLPFMNTPSGAINPPPPPAYTYKFTGNRNKDDRFPNMVNIYRPLSKAGVYVGNTISL